MLLIKYLIFISGIVDIIIFSSYIIVYNRYICLRESFLNWNGNIMYMSLLVVMIVNIVIEILFEIIDRVLVN